MGEVTHLQPLGRLSPPQQIDTTQDLSQFDSGKEPLDNWLRQRAIKADGPSARTFVVCAGRIVVGYYSLATGGVTHDKLNAKFRRNMPDPVPMMVLGRLAVDRRYQGQGIGGGLLRNAMQRVAEANRLAGFRALVVHAKDDDALAFYLRYGFTEFPFGSKTMFLPIETIVSGL